MPSTVKLPILGTVPKGGVVAGALAAVAVGGYTLYRHNMKSKTTGASTDAYGYGTSAYGYGQQGTGGYYGYGYAYGGVSGGAIDPYPVGSEYGYGAFGYGYYNPYTGQYQGGGTGSGAITPQPQPQPNGTCAPGYTFVSGTPTTLPTGAYAVQGGYCTKNPATGGNPPPKQGSCTQTANGKLTLYWFALNHGMTWNHLLKLNPNLNHLKGKHRPIPKGTKVKVC
jgi:hypothetical protein